jgi:hypothetical protein
MRNESRSANNMNRRQLVELARTVTSSVPLQRLVVAGSQAFYGASGANPDIVLQSIEADLLLTGEDFAHRQAIEDGFGMASQYLSRTGVFAHPVGRGTITLPPGWEERLVPFGRDDGLLNVWTLEIHDLAATKLMAAREKDFAFLRALLDHHLCDFPRVLARMELLRAGVYANAIPDRLAKLTRHLREWKRDDLARSIPAQPHN